MLGIGTSCLVNQFTGSPHLPGPLIAGPEITSRVEPDTSSRVDPSCCLAERASFTTFVVAASTIT